MGKFIKHLFIRCYGVFCIVYGYVLPYWLEMRHYYLMQSPYLLTDKSFSTSLTIVYRAGYRIVIRSDKRGTNVAKILNIK